MSAAWSESSGSSRGLARLAADPLDLLPVAVYVCDAAGAIERHNRRAAELWGRTPEAGTAAELFFADKLRTADCSAVPLPFAALPIAEALRTGRPVAERDYMLERADGTRLVLSASAEPLRDAEGRIAGAIACFQDVTERRQAEDELRRRQQDLEDFF